MRCQPGVIEVCTYCWLPAAPEVLAPTGQPYGGEAADVWSTGVILYICLFGEYPFLHEADLDDPLYQFQGTLKRIMAVDYTLPAEVPISGQCKDLLQSIFVADPAKRITMVQMQKHPWFQEGLPEGVRMLNQQCLQLTQHVPGRQAEHDIRQVSLSLLGSAPFGRTVDNNSPVLTADMNCGWRTG